MKPLPAPCSVERLRELLHYDETTGTFERLTGQWRGHKCGTVGPHGYRVIDIARQKCLAHRLAWFHVHGLWPADDVDHINGQRDDNRIANLRLATRSENIAAKRSANRNGKGVICHPNANRRKRFGAQICKNGETRFLGWYASAIEAAEAYQRAAVEAHREFARW